MRKIPLLFCFSMIIVLLSGCGSALGAVPTQEQVILRFAYRQGIANYDVLAKEFHKQHPEVTIELIPIELQGGTSDLNKSKADVVRWDANLILSEQPSNLLKMDDMVTGEAVFPMTDFMPGTLDALRVDGILLGVPAGINPIVMFASVQPFQKAGLPLPSTNWNLDEMVYLANSVNRQDVAFADQQYTIGFCTTYQALDPLILTYMYGGSIFDRLPNPSQATLDTQINIEAIQWIDSLYNDYGITPNPESSELSSTRGFYSAILNNKCGFWIGPMSDFQVAFQQFNMEYEVRILPLPFNQEPFSVANMDGYFIYNSFAHPMAAWEWVSFLLEHEESAGMMIPVRRSQIESDSYNRRVSSDVLNIASSIQDNMLIMSVDLTQTGAVKTTAEAFLLAINWVLTKDYDPIAALEAAQQVAENAFQYQP